MHIESVYRGAEVVCTECSAILRLRRTDPILLEEVGDEEDES